MKLMMRTQNLDEYVPRCCTAVQIFPKSIVAAIFGFKEKKLLEIAKEEREAVKIDSNTVRS